MSPPSARGSDRATQRTPHPGFACRQPAATRYSTTTWRTGDTPHGEVAPAERGAGDRRPPDRARRRRRQRRRVRQGRQLRRLHPGARHRLRGAAVDPTGPPKRAGAGERDRRDFPGFYASGLWFAGSGGPIRPGFATPGQAHTTNQQESACCTGAVTLHRPGRHAEPTSHNLKAAIAGKDVEGFIAALGPLSLGAGCATSTTPAKKST